MHQQQTVGRMSRLSALIPLAICLCVAIFIGCPEGQQMTKAVTPPEPVDTADRPDLYWTNWDEDGKIQRGDPNTGVVEDLGIGLDRVVGIVLDVANHKIYWTSHNVIGCSDPENLYGPTLDIIVSEGVGLKEALALDTAGGKLYWTVWDGDNKIQRSNLDGSNVEDLVTGLRSPRGIALDVPNGKMYWADNGTGKIQCSNLDGSNVEDLVTGLPGANGVALDLNNHQIYWTDESTGKIQAADTDGSNLRDIVVGLEFPIGIALESAGEKVYWADYGARKIQAANLDGSGIADVFTGIQVLNLYVNPSK